MYCRGRLILLTALCRVLEKLTGLQLVKKFPVFLGTRRFITALISVRHLSLSWASTIQSIYPHPTSWRSILIFYGTRMFITALKRPPPVSILGQPNPVHISTSHVLEIHPNIHPSTPRSPQWSPSLRFPHQVPIHPSLLTHTRHLSDTNTKTFRITPRHSAVGTVSRLRIGLPRNRRSISGSCKRFVSSSIF